MPIFILPKQFLICIATKFLTNHKQNLLLTEFYKERLELQLKNRETYIYTYITSTKLTNDF